MLFLHPTIFPDKKLWYGPHSGDEISEYLSVDNMLYAARVGTTELWTMDVVDNAYSMTDQATPRTVTMVWPTIVLPSLKHALWDVVGVLVNLEPENALSFMIDVAGAARVLQASATAVASGTTLVWDSDTVGNWDDFVWGGPRDLLLFARSRNHGPTGKVTVSYSDAEPIMFQNLYCRIKEYGHQPTPD